MHVTDNDIVLVMWKYMRLNEVIKQVDLSKRTIKFYEEKSLFKTKRDSNGYRNYTDKDISLLK